MIRSSRTYHGSATWAAIASASSSSVAIGATGSPSTGSPGTGAGGSGPPKFSAARIASGRAATRASSSAASPSARHASRRAPRRRRRRRAARPSSASARGRCVAASTSSAPRSAARASSSSPQRSSRASASPWMSAAWCVSAIVAATGGPPARSSSFRRGAHGLLRRGGERGPEIEPARERLDAAQLLDREADDRRGRRRSAAPRGRPPARRARHRVTASARQSFVYQLVR